MGTNVYCITYNAQNMKSKVHKNSHTKGGISGLSRPTSFSFSQAINNVRSPKEYNALFAAAPRFQSLSVYISGIHLFTACSMARSYKGPSFGSCPSIGKARAERRTVEPQIRTRASPCGLSFSIVAQDGLLWQIWHWRDFWLPRSVRIEQSWMCDGCCVLRVRRGEDIAPEHFLYGHVVRP